MFKKILVANRGDIAVRIIRACREIGVSTVAVYSSADIESLHANLANESYCIGSENPSHSYRNIDAILCAAVNSGADAIHPGYGFLADDPELPGRCRELGITYIGASPELIEQLNDEEITRSIMKAAGIPTNEKKLKSVPKIIDVQIISDSSGRIIVVGDRDMSYNYNSYRLMGEAPACGISEKVRKKLHKSAIAAVQALNYVGVGNASFYVDTDGNYCIKRFVPRLQVGCSITEMQSRVDLIHWQIRIAAGELISFSESTICRFGHSIGCRIYAIHPEQFYPSTGRINILHIPGGYAVQFDTAVYQGCSIPLAYEPLLGKLMVYSRTREHAIRKIKAALKELVTDGVYNNSEIYYNIIDSEEFISGDYNTESYNSHMIKIKQK